jgi:hypothetical protein
MVSSMNWTPAASAELVAGDAQRETGKILDPLDSTDLAADAYAIDHSDLHTVAPRHHGGGKSRHASADDHNIDVLHNPIVTMSAARRQASRDDGACPHPRRAILWWLTQH